MIINHHFILVLCGSVVGAHAQSTAFTYQGRLNDNGGPANGSYDLAMALFNVPSSGSALAGPLTNPAVAVSNGLFTVLLDFGGSIFDGNPYFLEIGVRTAGGGNFTMLSPRQPITPAPYAIFANTAANARNITGGSVTRLNNLSNNVTLAAGQNVTITPGGNTLTIGASGINPWQTSGTNVSYSAGNVGIGTALPQARLQIAAPTGGATPGEGIRIQGSAPGAPNQAYLSFWDSLGTRLGFVGDGSTGDRTVFLASDSGDVVLNPSEGRVLTATSGGSVGIGTTTPQAKLEVRGDIRLGASGQFRATGGEENLRIIRGRIDTFGTIFSGSGFTTQRIGGAHVRVTFNTPFAGVPAVVATAQRPTATVDSARVVMTDFNGVTPADVVFLTRAPEQSDYAEVLFDFIAIGPR